MSLANYWRRKLGYHIVLRVFVRHLDDDFDPFMEERPAKLCEMRFVQAVRFMSNLSRYEADFRQTITCKACLKNLADYIGRMRSTDRMQLR